MSLDLKAAEIALLIAKWPSSLSSSSHPSLLLVKNVIEGDFCTPLTSQFAQDLFTVQTSNIDIVNCPIEQWFSLVPEPLENSAEHELLRLTLGVACLHAFVQANWTGPDLNLKISDVLVVPVESPSLSEEFLHRKAIAELAYGGEPAYHLAQVSLLLRLATLLFDLPYQYCQSAPWWRLRTWLVREQVFDEPAAVPEDVLPSVEPLLQTIASEPDLAGRLLLEQGLLEHLFAHDKAAAEYFVRAARATQLVYELTGALGKRTKFQQTDVTQLVLLAESRKRETPESEPVPATAEHDKRKDTESNPELPPTLPETLALNDDTLLEQTQYTSSSHTNPASRLNHIDPGNQPALDPLDQCILLCLCLNVHNTSPSHGLTAEQMAPYVARVVSHPRNWSIHTMALLLRSRLESTRTRTVERATLQLQALVDQMPTADSTVTERLLYYHAIPLPNKWEMEKELATRFMSLGVVKSALAIYERREMWEEVAQCWQSMERRDKAVAVVRDLLEGRRAESDVVVARGKSATTADRRRVLDVAREAKLWCLLGDLEPERAVEHYTHAWELSQQMSSRAMRSLGGYYFARQDYPNTILCLRRAVKINPLLARTWFVLGCAHLRAEDWPGARECFARCVALDDEDGESWNNLASVYLRMSAQDAGGSAEDKAQPDARDAHPDGIPYAHKMLAFRALRQGLKFSYDNWRMWVNYMVVAMDVGELAEATRALGRVVEERSAKDGAGCVDEDVLDRLVDAVTRTHTDEDAGANADAARRPDGGHGLSKRVLELIERTILPRVSSARIFRAYARLLTWLERWEAALGAYLDGYRCGVAGTMESGEVDAAKWREAVGEVEEMVDVLRNFGPRVEGSRWRLQARSIVRAFMGKTRDFAEEPEWERLEGLLEDIRAEA